MDTREKPFPLPGSVWKFNGTETCPEPSGPHTVIGLRWFMGQAQAMFHGPACAGIEHMMTNDAWECISADPRSVAFADRDRLVALVRARRDRHEMRGETFELAAVEDVLAAIQGDGVAPTLEAVRTMKERCARVADAAKLRADAALLSSHAPLRADVLAAEIGAAIRALK